MRPLTAPYRPRSSIGKLMAAIALAGVGFGLIVSGYREKDAWLLLLAWVYNLVALPMISLGRLEHDVPQRWQRVAAVVLYVWLALGCLFPVWFFLAAFFS